MLDRLKIGTHITLFPEWLIEWEGNPSELALASFFCWQRKNIGGRGKRCKGQGTIRRRAALASFPVLCTLKKQKMRLKKQLSDRSSCFLFFLLI